MQGVRTTVTCVGCKRRKKGCDFGKPSCGRCLHLGISCRYEQRQYTFIDAKTGTVIPGKASTSVVSSRPSSISSSSTPDSGLSLAETFSLLSTDNELQHVAAFWDIWLPTEDVYLDGCIGGIYTAPWLPTARELADKDSAVRHALNAVAFAGLGWWREDQSLVKRGIKTYTQALRAVNEALQDPVQAQSDSTLACCRVLSLFEMFRRAPGAKHDTQVMDWRRHSDGTYQLLRIRGRARHTSGHGMALYDGVRLTAIIQGLGRRQSNAFTELAWDIEGNTLRDELFNIMNEVPNMLSRSDDVRLVYLQGLNHTEHHEQLEEAIVKGTSVMQDLIDTAHKLQAWEDTVLQCCSISGATSEELLEECKSYGYAFFFACTQYWAMCITTHSSIRMLEQALIGLSIERSCPIPTWIDPEPHAQKISEVSSHFFEPGAGLWAAQSAIFPLSTALIYFMRTGRRGTPCFNQMTDAFRNSKSGLIVKEFLQGVQLEI